MKTARPMPALVLVALLFLLPLSSRADAPVFDPLLEPYDRIRLALANDTLDGVANAAGRIAETAGMAGHVHPGGKAGSPVTEMRDTKPLLDRLVAEARTLAKVKDLDTARTSFARMSDMLIEYRRMTHSKSGVVVYCPMATQSWLQKDDKITNPFYGAAMVKCGQIVND